MWYRISLSPSYDISGNVNPTRSELSVKTLPPLGPMKPGDDPGENYAIGSSISAPEFAWELVFLSSCM